MKKLLILTILVLISTCCSAQIMFNWSQKEVKKFIKKGFDYELIDKYKGEGDALSWLLFKDPSTTVGIIYYFDDNRVIFQRHVYHKRRLDQIIKYNNEKFLRKDDTTWLLLGKIYYRFVLDVHSDDDFFSMWTFKI